jgi:hypothetical protein
LAVTPHRDDAIGFKLVERSIAQAIIRCISQPSAE